MKPDRIIQFGYVAGISLLLSAIIYFFASNWPGLDKWAKIALSVGLMGLFYGLSILFSRLLYRRVFLSDLLLFAGCITFGVGTGLLGQIYNSHADSFVLFLIWLVPSLLFSFVSRYQPFYVLSYVLLHLTVWFFMFPATVFIANSEGEIVIGFLLLALLNLIIYGAIEKGFLKSKALQFLSFVMFHGLMIPLTITNLFETYGFTFNFVYILLLATFFYYVLKSKVQKTFIVLLGLVTTSYIIIKFIELLFEYFTSEIFFVLVLMFAIAIVIGNVFFIKWLMKFVKEESGVIWKKLLIGFITAIASVLGTASIMGLIILLSGDVSEYLFYVIAVGVFIVPMMLLRSIDSTIRYTLLSIGYLMGASVSLFVHIGFLIAFLFLLGASWFMIRNYGVRLFAYLIANALSLGGYFHHSAFWSHGETVESGLLTLTVINASLYVYSYFVKDRSVRQSLKHNGLFYTLVFFLSLTFFDHLGMNIYYVYNILYFFCVTGFIYWAHKSDKVIELRLGLFFWFAFLFYKYYDFVWKLVHKSLALFAIGLVILAIVYWFDKRNYTHRVEGRKASFLKTKIVLISLIIGSQFGLMGVQIAKSEYVLSTGELIKLELQPIDPRALIQGDYVRLNYVISSLDLGKEIHAREKVQVILTPNAAGVYEYSGVYKYKGEYNKEYVKNDSDVFITAKSNGRNRLIYGIESFFIPEGTGRVVEEEAHFAYVRVASNGDALLVRLAEE